MNTTLSLINAPIPTERFTIVNRLLVTALILLALFGYSTRTASAQSPFQPKGGTINFASAGVSSFAFSGNEPSSLGQYRCHGEIQFRSSRAEEPLQGVGSAVFEAANGDRLVATMTVQTSADGTGQMVFAWRDSARFNDGSVFASSGHFARSRPANTTTPIKTHPTVVIAIIAILIGL